MCSMSMILLVSNVSLTGVISLVAFIDIYLTFCPCVFSNVSSNGLPEKMHSHRLHLVGFSPLWFFKNDSSNCLHKQMYSHIGFIYLLFLAVHFQMFPQIACINGCIITLVAFVGLFSTVHFQMSPQMACPRRCKVT